MKTSTFPGLLSPQGLLGMSCFLTGVRIMVCPGVRLEGWLRWFAQTLGGGVQEGGGIGSTLLSLLALPKWKLGFSVSLYLLSRICPNCACTWFFLVPYGFFVFCCWRRGVSRGKHCGTAAKGPRSQPVSLIHPWKDCCEDSRGYCVLAPRCSPSPMWPLRN